MGNEFRQDDGLGPYMARQLRAQNLIGIKVMENNGDCTQIFEPANSSKQLLLVDAVKSGRVPGTIFRLNRDQLLESREFFSYSTHAVGLWQCISMAKMLDTLPGLIYFFGIEGRNFGYGNVLTPTVEKAAQKLLPDILNLLQGNAL